MVLQLGIIQTAKNMTGKTGTYDRTLLNTYFSIKLAVCWISEAPRVGSYQQYKECVDKYATSDQHHSF